MPDKEVPEVTPIEEGRETPAMFHERINRRLREMAVPPSQRPLPPLPPDCVSVPRPPPLNKAQFIELRGGPAIPLQAPERSLFRPGRSGRSSG
jgi:hypothetical protein